MALTKHDRILAVHAFFACLLAVILLPLSLLITQHLRFKEGAHAAIRLPEQDATPSPRGKSPRWLPLHSTLNHLSFLVLALVFGLGLAGVLVEVAEEEEGGGPALLVGQDDNDLHHTLGLAIIILFALQVLLGWGSHYVKKQWSSSKHPLRMLHVVLGIGTVALLYWETWNGLSIEWPAMTDQGEDIPLVVQIIFWILLAFAVGLWSARYGADILERCEERQGYRPLLRGGDDDDDDDDSSEQDFSDKGDRFEGMSDEENRGRVTTRAEAS